MYIYIYIYHLYIYSIIYIYTIPWYLEDIQKYLKTDSHLTANTELGPPGQAAWLRLPLPAGKGPNQLTLTNLHFPG